MVMATFGGEVAISGSSIARDVGFIYWGGHHDSGWELSG
jgi:hypothetical protein